VPPDGRAWPSSCSHSSIPELAIKLCCNPNARALAYRVVHSNSINGLDIEFIHSNPMPSSAIKLSLHIKPAIAIYNIQHGPGDHGHRQAGPWGILAPETAIQFEKKKLKPGFNSYLTKTHPPSAAEWWSIVLADWPPSESEGPCGTSPPGDFT
jgi:hypothetical protein